MTIVLDSQAQAFGVRFREHNFSTLLNASGLPEDEQRVLMERFEQVEATEILQIIREAGIKASDVSSYAELLFKLENTPAPQ